MTHPVRRVFAVDPGSVESGFVEYDPFAMRLVEFGVVDNNTILSRCYGHRASIGFDAPDGWHMAIEMVDVFGMAGRTVFETCVWIGRFIEAWGDESYTKLTRHDVKMHLCHTKRSDDSMVRAALIERWGGEAVAIGGKGRGKAKTPYGPLHGVAAHAWAALGVAVTWADSNIARRTA